MVKTSNKCGRSSKWRGSDVLQSNNSQRGHSAMDTQVTLSGGGITDLAVNGRQEYTHGY